LTDSINDGNTPLHEWTYPLDDRPRTVKDEFGIESKDKTEPVENLITWIFESGSFVPAAKIVGDKQYSIITDYLGTPVEAYDTDGNKVWERELDTYGRFRNEKGSANFVAFTYQGMYQDDELGGLIYNRFRFYDSNTGNYISQDPIRLAGNNPTLYAYVHDTNTWIDPFGLLSATELAAAQQMGASAETIAQNKFGFEKNTIKIDSIRDGRYHIPDGMMDTTIYEVKCVKQQGYTRQLKSYVNTGKKVVLIVDTDTKKLSKPLQQAIADGKIKLERTDLKNRPKTKCH